MRIKIGGKFFNIKNLKTCNELEKFIGLMFSSRENAKALLFKFEKPKRLAIHSFFVFYPFLAIWLGEKDKIVKMSIVKPFTLSIKPKKSFTKLIEIPLSKKYEKVTKNIYHRRVLPKI
ncbi:MAG: DUF192 domain-containing protein [Nanoarchaeota archaeon]|nr:DUF192 domain-containing protein [Nanoarchaeota archaeon]